MAEVDIAAVFSLLGTVASDVREQTRKLNEVIGTVNDHGRKLTELATDLGDLKQDVSSLKIGQATIRKEIADYHSSVLGHGILISELDERVRRIERQLGITPGH